MILIMITMSKAMTRKLIAKSFMLMGVDSICYGRYKTSKYIPVVFHNGSVYDYHFMIKHLKDEFEG